MPESTSLPATLALFCDTLENPACPTFEAVKGVVERVEPANDRIFISLWPQRISGARTKNMMPSGKVPALDVNEHSTFVCGYTHSSRASSRLWTPSDSFRFPIPHRLHLERHPQYRHHFHSLRISQRSFPDGQVPGGGSWTIKTMKLPVSPPSDRLAVMLEMGLRMKAFVRDGEGFTKCGDAEKNRAINTCVQGMD